ncbi:hypothetical protein D4100_07370 [Serratia inhibens]|uniref:Baseplate protein J-like domain-containing protein n=1 Tax=Serratia inhibens TaxID=2338073 RepID=A0AA93BXS4_9GAMM|nr:hypothetical protein [Serratia inhibens]RJF58559.1 hypothetical protein D4100_07370 [Serratia inhibens]
MSDLEELKKKLAVAVAESTFELEPRTAAAVLKNIEEYTRLIPFAGDKNATWDRFWLAERTPDKLGEIYRDVSLAGRALPPHQAFLLALLRLLETPRLLMNTLPARHRSLYYQNLLGFSPRDNQPDRVVVSFALQRDIAQYLLPIGTPLDAGQDGAGNAILYRTDEALLITRQRLSQLCWTRQEKPGEVGSEWWICTALDQDNNIDLPADGIRLFSATDNEQKLNQNIFLTLPPGLLNADVQLEARWETEDTRGPLFSLVGDNAYLDFRPAGTDGQRTVYVLSSATLRREREEAPQAWKTPHLALRFPAGEAVVLPASLTLTVSNDPAVSYLSHNRDGHIHAFSFPFGLQPQLGNAFELALPAAFLRTGGELTIEPRWHDVPQESFPRWYADYPEPPADNAVFKVRIHLLTPEGGLWQSEEQALFSGEGVPQGAALRVMLPALAAAVSGCTVRVELCSSDFLHAAWRQAPAGKNAPWTPQVSGIDTHFHCALPLPTMAKAQRSTQIGQALYLGFSEVAPGDSLSVYWSLSASEALALSWFYYSQQEVWLPLEAELLDGTGGLSASALWQATLPADCAPGGDGRAAECYWIKAIPAGGATLSTDRAPMLRAVMAGAMTATLDNTTDIDDSHFVQALPAGTISQLVSPIAEISRVSQPLPSTGGKVRETEEKMFARAAARITHRRRGITWGDMRSLLMEQYPQLFDVQTPGVAQLNRIPAPKTQQLLVIPDSRYRDNDDALRPALSPGRLVTMAEWLAQYVSLWVTPELVNPVYIDITARYRVTFTAGISAGYGYQQLAGWLQRRYMPWGENQQLAVTPGNQLDYYQLLATIQQFPLVQRVLALTLTDQDGVDQQQTIIAGDNEVLILLPEPEATSLNGEHHV